MSNDQRPKHGSPVSLPGECTHVLVDGELVYPLRFGINTIGRSLDSDVFLCEKHVSRRHCVILVHSTGSCDLIDAGSQNGTWLNGRRVAKQESLHTGDHITLCNREFTFLPIADFRAIDGDTLDG